MRKRLISLETLDTLMCDFFANNDTMNIAKGASVVMKGKKMRNLYILIGESIAGGAMIWKVFLYC